MILSIAQLALAPFLDLFRQPTSQFQLSLLLYHTEGTPFQGLLAEKAEHSRKQVCE